MITLLEAWALMGFDGSREPMTQGCVQHQVRGGRRQDLGSRLLVSSNWTIVGVKNTAGGFFWMSSSSQQGRWWWWDGGSTVDAVNAGELLHADADVDGVGMADSCAKLTVVISSCSSESNDCQTLSHSRNSFGRSSWRQVRFHLRGNL